MKCSWCERRRKLRGSKVCDECATDYWLDENTLGPYEDEPTYEIDWLWERSALPGEHRIALIAEKRWKPVTKDMNYVGSQLWDKTTPSC